VNLLEKAQRKASEAEIRFNEALDAIENLDDTATDERVAELDTELDEAERSLSAARTEVERYERVYAAREAAPALAGPESKDERITVGEEEKTYRKDGQNSFFRDLVFKASDPGAAERLNRHTAEMAEQRAITGAGGGAGFIPPVWLADEWVSVARAGRKFADKLPKMPMPPLGETITIPKVSTGVGLDVQNPENAAVSSVDITSTTITSNLVTIAGQQDVSRQSLERSYPGLDMVIFDDLMRAYDAKLDSQLLTGSGSNGQHLGLRNVSGVNTVTYTQSTPDGGTCVQQIYAAVSQVYTNRFMQPDLIVMHPRRAAWLASTLASTFPLFQQGALFHASGDQDDGFVGSIAGIPVLTDPNVTTTQGASTNQDEIYVVYSPDFRLAEDALRQATFEEVLSGTLTVRLQLYAFSFAALHRYPKSIAIISGTGLVAPSGF
jgi:HK97 family phage major capsid protein